MPDLTFPNNQDAPTFSTQCEQVSVIAGNISLKFLRPKVDARFWNPASCWTRVLMPEATMDEYNSLELWKDQIGCARQISPVQSESISHRMRDATDGHFRITADRADERHPLASLLGREIIH
jgi:hypothetical protein